MQARLVPGCQDWEFGNNTDGISSGNSAQPHLLQADLALVLPDKRTAPLCRWPYQRSGLVPLPYDGQLLLQDTLTIEDVGTGTGNITANVGERDLTTIVTTTRPGARWKWTVSSTSSRTALPRALRSLLGMEVVYPNPTRQFHAGDPIRIQQGKVTVFDVRGTGASSND